MGLFGNFLRNTNRGHMVPEARAVIDLGSLHHDVAEFVTKLEVEETHKWCKCLWRIHPDDQGIKLGLCRECSGSISALIHKDIGADNYHTFRGIRRVRVDDHPLCPVHTREGLLVGFIEWVTDVR